MKQPTSTASCRTCTKQIRTHAGRFTAIVYFNVRLLEDSAEVVVVAAVGTATELLDAVERLRPQAVLTDNRMLPGHHAASIAPRHAIRARHPEVGVVVLSQHAEEAYAFQLFQHGAAGLAYLLKERVGDLDELLRALHEVVAGRSVIDAQIVELLVAHRARVADSLASRVSSRELEVLREMAQGKSHGAIAQALVLSESAVEKHVNAIFCKLGLSEEPHVHRRVAAELTYLRDMPNTPTPA
jgi:DNA-binding NarL/FixJ family response regulator